MLNKPLYTWNKFHLLMLHISGQFTCLFFIPSLESTGTKSHWLHLWTWTLTTRSALLPHVAKPLGGWCWLSWTWVHCVSLNLKHRLLAFLWRGPLGVFIQFLSVITQQVHPNPSLWLEHYSKNPVHSHINPDQIPLRLGWENFWEQAENSSITCWFTVASLFFGKAEKIKNHWNPVANA